MDRSGEPPAGRRDLTTAQIRSAACAELAEVGPRAFSLQAVAKRAFVSVGAVYERWPNSETCIRDLVTIDLPLRVDDVTTAWALQRIDVESLVVRDLRDHLVLADLRFIVECAFAARDHHDLQPTVTAEIQRLGSLIAQRLGLAALRPTLDWWIVST